MSQHEDRESQIQRLFKMWECLGLHLQNQCLPLTTVAKVEDNHSALSFM